MVDRERALGSDLLSLVHVLDATDTEVEADAKVEVERFDPERETDSYTEKCKERRLTCQGSRQHERTLLKLSFELVLDSTLETW